MTYSLVATDRGTTDPRATAMGVVVLGLLATVAIAVGVVL